MVCTEPGVLPGSEYYIFHGYELNHDVHPYMALCGHYRCCFGYKIKRHYYDHLLICYIVKGIFHLQYQNKKYEAGPGQAVIIDCRHPHHFWSGKSMEFLWIHFNGGNTHEICRDLNQRYGPVINHMNCAFIRDEISLLVNRFKNQQEITASAIASLILDLMYTLFDLAGSRKMPEIDVHPAVRTAIEYMKYNLGNTVTIEDLASAAHMSRYHFSRIFKEAVGYSPYDYLLKLRMDMAKYLLAATDQPIEKIASSLGYSSRMGFSMAFTGREGCPPGKYRQARRKLT